MKYSGYIDGLLAEAAFAKKTGDVSWLQKMMEQEEDPIKRILLSEVCSDGFINGVKRNSQWLKDQKTRLEAIALDELEEETTDRIIRQVEESLKKDKAQREHQDEDSVPPLDLLKGDPFFSEEDQEQDSGPLIPLDEDNPEEDPSKMDQDGMKSEQEKQPGPHGANESGSLREQSDNETDDQWERMRSEAMQNYKENLQKKEQAKQMNDISKSMNTDIPGFGRGKAEEEIRKAENQTLKKIPASLKKLARMIGRTGGFDTEMGKTFGRASKSDISGITVGDDLNSLLPSEIAVLSDKRTQDVFYKNYAEKRLQVFASASSGEQKKQRQDGPVIICLDTSSSMNGEPARIARMLTIAVSIYAMRRRRKVMVVKYSNSHSIETFTKRRADRPRLMKFLQWTGVGGNSENRMFEDIFENVLPQEPKFDAADILCISDFGWETLNTKVTELIAKAKSDGMKFYGLVVGHRSWMGYRHENAIQVCDSKWQWIKGECQNIDDKCAKDGAES